MNESRLAGIERRLEAAAVRVEQLERRAIAQGQAIAGGAWVYNPGSESQPAVYYDPVCGVLIPSTLDLSLVWSISDTDTKSALVKLTWNATADAWTAQVSLDWPGQIDATFDDSLAVTSAITFSLYLPTPRIQGFSLKASFTTALRLVGNPPLNPPQSLICPTDGNGTAFPWGWTYPVLQRQCSPWGLYVSNRGGSLTPVYFSSIAPQAIWPFTSINVSIPSF